MTIATRRSGAHRFCLPAATLVLGALVQGCSGESAVSQDPPASSTVNVSGQLLAALRDVAEQFSPPGEPRLPADIYVHLQTQFESFALEALLFTHDGTGAAGGAPAAAVIAQIDRFALQPAGATGEVDSRWRYDSIMRSSVSIDAAASHSTLASLGELERRETIQRMALELAGATAQSVWVGNDRLTIDVSGKDQTPCERQYRWEAALSAEQQITLEFSIATCPQVRAVGELNTWSESAVSITGTLPSVTPAGEPMNAAVSGTGWIRQSWGNVPGAAGAVVIDTLTLALDDGQRLDVSRSRRRSGRGPQTVSATLHATGQKSQALDLQWVDSTEQLLSADSGSAYPQHVSLRSSDGSLDIRASIMNRLSESSVGSDIRAHVPVVVTGTHTGAGFLSLTALPASPGDRAAQ